MLFICFDAHYAYTTQAAEKLNHLPQHRNPFFLLQDFIIESIKYANCLLTFFRTGFTQQKKNQTQFLTKKGSRFEESSFVMT